MKRLVNSLSRYTGLSTEELTMAFEAIQDDVKEEVEDMFYSTATTYVDSSEDGEFTAVDDGGFFDWLFDNYEVTPR